jgi:hypothetical protein
MYHDSSSTCIAFGSRRCWVDCFFSLYNSSHIRHHASHSSVLAQSNSNRNNSSIDMMDTTDDEEGPAFDGRGGMGQPKGTVNTYHTLLKACRKCHRKNIERRCRNPSWNVNDSAPLVIPILRGARRPRGIIVMLQSTGSF